MTAVLDAPPTGATICDSVKLIVTQNPGKTSNELEAMYPQLGDGRLRKRLTDLAKAGYIYKGESRPSSITGVKGGTWYPVITGEKAA